MLWFTDDEFSLHLLGYLIKISFSPSVSSRYGVFCKGGILKKDLHTSFNSVDIELEPQVAEFSETKPLD